MHFMQVFKNDTLIDLRARISLLKAGSIDPSGPLQEEN